MKMNFLKTTIVSAIFCLSTFVANAGLIYHFDVSDVSTSNNTRGDFDGVTMMIEFLHHTDFTNVQDNDVVGFGFSSKTNNYFTNTNFDKRAVNHMFDLVNNEVLLIVGKVDGHPDSAIYSYLPGMFFQVGAGNNSGLYLVDEEGVQNEAFPGPPNSTGIYKGVLIASVPEPSTFAILALGLMGLAARKVKRNS